jgi:hypothetical protein
VGHEGLGFLSFVLLVSEGVTSSSPDSEAVSATMQRSVIQPPYRWYSGVAIGIAIKVIDRNGIQEVEGYSLRLHQFVSCKELLFRWNFTSAVRVLALRVACTARTSVSQRCRLQVGEICPLINKHSISDPCFLSVNLSLAGM